MNVGDFSELTSHLSLEEIVNGDFSGVFAVLYLAVSISIYSIIIYHFYRYVARRDCFKPSKKKFSKSISFCKYFFFFPVVAIIFYLGFSLMILFLAKDISVPIVLETAFAIILAIRITSYYTEDLSKDVAKMLPFALLGVFLVSPSFFELSDIIAKIESIPNFANTSIQFIVFIIIVEWILRLILNIKYLIIPNKEGDVSE